MSKLMIYGATGYAGRMAAEHGRAAGLPLVLAGRSAKPLASLADELNVEHRALDLCSSDAIDAALADVQVLLNCPVPSCAPPSR